VTPNNFSRNEAIQILYTLVEVIKETIETSIIGCTKWVINLEKPTQRTQVKTQLSLEMFQLNQGSLYITKVD
jgi:hypothetical protein